MTTLLMDWNTEYHDSEVEVDEDFTAVMTALRTVPDNDYAQFTETGAGPICIRRECIDGVRM